MPPDIPTQPNRPTDPARLYTLEEAAAEFAAQACATHGHQWDELGLKMIQPVRITCTRCGATYDLVKVEDE